jgi:hypothetical protein
MYRARKKQERSTDVNTQRTASDDEDTCDEDAAETMRNNSDIPEDHEHPAILQTEYTTVVPIIQPADPYVHGNGESSEQEIQPSLTKGQRSNQQQSNQRPHNAGIHEDRPAIRRTKCTTVEPVTHLAVRYEHGNGESSEQEIQPSLTKGQRSNLQQSNQQSLSTKEKNRLRQQQCRSRKKQIDIATGVQLPRQKKLKHSVQRPDDLAYDLCHALVVGTHAHIEVSSFQYPENNLNYTLKTAAEFQKMLSEHLPTGICAVCARRTATCDTIMHAIDDFPHLKLLSCSRPVDEDVHEYPRHALTRCKIKNLECCLDSNGVQGNCYNNNILCNIMYMALHS